MSQREVAWRVFAKEFNASTSEIQAPDEYSPSYQLSPLGAQINRVFVVGIVTDVQNVGQEDQPLWRAKITDPTGVFFVSAGKYQPKVAQVLSGLEPMTFVAVVGKTKTYSPQDGTVYVSIRPETVVKVDNKARSSWIVEAAGSLKERLDYFREASLLEPPDEEKLSSLGVPEYLQEGILKAIGTYNDPSVEPKFRNILMEVLTDFLMSGGGEVIPPLDSQDDLPSPINEKESAEEAVMMLIASMSRESEMLKVEDIKVQAVQLKLPKSDIDELLGELLEKGNIFEPEIGYIQMV